MPATAVKMTDTEAGPDVLGPADTTPLSLVDERPKDAVILERLREMRRLGVKDEELAGGIGVHRGTLLRSLDPKYPGARKPSEEFLSKAWVYIRLTDMRQEDSEVGRTADTSVVRRVAKLIDYCQVERVMGMLVSETSAGKTTALKAYAAANPSAMYVHANSRANCVSGLIAAIWEQSKASKGQYKTFGEKWDDLIRIFNTRGSLTSRVLLIDDAHVLVYRVLEALRELHDETGIGVVLAGTTRLQDRLTLSGDAHQMYEQLRARVQIVRVIRKPTPADVAAVARAWAPGRPFTAEALKHLLDLATCGLGALRLVKGHVRMALRLGGKDALGDGEPIDRTHLERAGELLRDRASSLA